MPADCGTGVYRDRELHHRDPPVPPVLLSSAGLAPRAAQGLLPPEDGTWVRDLGKQRTSAALAALQSPAVTCRSQQLLLRKGFPHKPQKELSQVTPGCNTHIDSHLTVQEGGESCAQDLPGLLPVADDT